MKILVFVLFLVCFCFSLPLTASAQLMQSNNYSITDLSFGTDLVLGIDQNTAPPQLLSGPTVTDLEPRKVTIEWVTDRKSSSTVRYGLTSSYNQENGSVTQSVNHKVTLFGLDPETTYHYLVVSTDVSGVSSQSVDKTFITPADAGINTIRVSDIGYDKALVTWKTGNATISHLEYGTTQSYGQIKATSSNAFSADHTVLLTGLTPGTEYHFRIDAENDKGEILRSTDQTFSTIAEPRFIKFSVVPIDVNSVALQWLTNTPTTGILKYHATTGPNQEEVTAGATELRASHELKLKNLIGDTVYSYAITATDQQGKQIKSGDQTFRTGIDKSPPVLSNLKVTVARSGDELVLTATWQTNEPAKGEIVFGPKTRVDQTVDLPGPDSYTTDHTLVATGLRPSTPYSLSAFSTDVGGNRGKADISFVSPKLSKTIIQLLIDSFLSKFGWLFNIFNR